MKTKLLIILALALAGCTTNGVYDAAKTWTLVGALALGAVAASSGGGSGGGDDGCYWVVTSNGSERVCPP